MTDLLEKMCDEPEIWLGYFAYDEILFQNLGNHNYAVGCVEPLAAVELKVRNFGGIPYVTWNIEAVRIRRELGHLKFKWICETVLELDERLNRQD